MENVDLKNETPTFGNVLLPAGVYLNVNEIKPKQEQAVIVNDCGDCYELAFWDNDLGFINQHGKLPNKFEYWTELPVNACR
jgi:hypothetical protein